MSLTGAQVAVTSTRHLLPIQSSEPLTCLLGVQGILDHAWLAEVRHEGSMQGHEQYVAASAAVVQHRRKQQDLPAVCQRAIGAVMAFVNGRSLPRQ